MGNLDAKRDWGHAKDYVEGMWMMLQQDTPEDYVLATGVTTSVRDFISMAFMELGIEVEFKGKEENEIGVIKSCANPEYHLPVGKEVVSIDKRYYRPAEVELLIGDASKAERNMGWKPKYDLAGIVKEMVASDLAIFKRDRYLKDGGHQILNYNE
jgi:GDPmannose 4,6-dehydratase